ncbi:MAG: glutamate formimidoyltransferase [Vicinamibacterales bacterium]
MLIETIPNVSEGRRSAVIGALARCCTAGGAHLLHTSSDPSHNRTVLTVAGTPEAVHQAMLALAAEAVRLIDLRRHDGVHPRVGAVDVMPFVPLAGAAMADAVALARRTATAIAATLDVPVFLYEEAATAAHRRRLDQIRAGGLPGLAERMLRPDWAPDAGPARPHPSAGVFVIGARRPLVAYNVDLDTRDMAAATAIARQVRARDGGLPGVKALPMWLAHRDRAQVSMNLTDLEQTTAAQAFDAVVHAAATAGIRVAESEVVGLIPEAALGGRTPADLRIANWTGDLLLEAQLQRAGLIS